MLMLALLTVQPSTAAPTAEDVPGLCCLSVVNICLLCVFRDKSAAEKRRQLIQESKFLGGDMEHTHLVKGLDFALLQKVRHIIPNVEGSRIVSCG